MARHVALESLGDHRNAFTQLLAKTLSVVVQCRGGDGEAGDDLLSTAGIGERVVTVVEDLAQREFPTLCQSLYAAVAE